MRTALLSVALAVGVMISSPSSVSAQTDVLALPDTTVVNSVPNQIHSFGIEANIVQAPLLTLDGFQIGVLMPEPTDTTFVGFVLGPLVAAMNGGSGPAFIAATPVDYNGGTENLLTMGLVADLTGFGSFPFDPVYLIVELQFVSTLPGGSFFLIDQTYPGSVPPVENTVAWTDASPPGVVTVPSVPFAIIVSQIIANEQFIRGDANSNLQVNIADPIHMLNELFVGTPVSTCQDANDVNDDGVFNIADPIAVLAYLFQAGVPDPPLPFPACGNDPTQDSRDCADGGC